MARSILDDDEKVLDPTLLRVQAKMRRLMLIAGVTLGVGMIAVFAAILYRIMLAGDKLPAAAWQPGNAIPALSRSEMGVPAGARLVSTASDGRRLILTYEESGGHALVFIDLATLRVTGRLDLGGP